MSLLEVFYTFFKKKIPYTYITCFMWISCKKKKTPINYIKIVSKQYFSWHAKKWKVVHLKI